MTDPRYIEVEGDKPKVDRTRQWFSSLRAGLKTAEEVSYELERLLILSPAETERIRRTPGHAGHPLCGIVIGSSWHEPVACAYPPGHTGDHSWASIPQFDPRGVTDA